MSCYQELILHFVIRFFVLRLRDKPQAFNYNVKEDGNIVSGESEGKYSTTL
jgi:hypothetical protein